MPQAGHLVGPRARCIKVVSGGLGFPWVSQGIRCKAHKNWKNIKMTPVFQQPRPPAGFVSFYLINWTPKIRLFYIVDSERNAIQKFWGRFSVILKFAILACQAIAFPLGFARNSQQQLQGQ